jgi:hypothetical protein
MSHLKLFISCLFDFTCFLFEIIIYLLCYYINLILEKERNLNSILKTELDEKEDIIFTLNIRLETERNLYFVQRSEIEEKDETISTLIKNEIAKNEVVMMSLMKLSQQNAYLNEELEKERKLSYISLEKYELNKSIIETSNYKIILKYANERNRHLLDCYKILKNEINEIREIMNSYIYDLKSQINKDLDICSNCLINKITINIHSYCNKCLIKKNDCYLMFHKKI